eukprot:Sdes_comp21518_c0_seq1m20132
MSRLYIGRINHEARERDIERHFDKFGKVRELHLKNGFGFIEFEDQRDADDAVYELNGKEFFGDRLIVEHARGRPRPGREFEDRRDSRGSSRRDDRRDDRFDRRDDRFERR